MKHNKLLFCKSFLKLQKKTFLFLELNKIKSRKSKLFHYKNHRKDFRMTITGYKKHLHNSPWKGMEIESGSMNFFAGNDDAVKKSIVDEININLKDWASYLKSYSWWVSIKKFLTMTRALKSDKIFSFKNIV